MVKNKLSSISKADSYEAMGAFWDNHDFTDFDDQNLPDVEFEIRDSVRIEAELLSRLEQIANSHGISVETLVNLWLQERVQQTPAQTM